MSEKEIEYLSVEAQFAIALAKMTYELYVRHQETTKRIFAQHCNGLP